MWELDYKESWVPKNRCFWTVVREKTLGSPLDCKEIQPVHPEGSQSWIFIWKNWCWSWNSNTLTTWCEELTHLKRPWCWERLKAGEEGADRGWDGWMVFLTQWTCVCCVLVVQSCVTFCDPVDYSCQAPLSMGFSRWEYWSGLPFPSPWDLPNPGIEPGSPA